MKKFLSLLFITTLILLPVFSQEAETATMDSSLWKSIGLWAGAIGIALVAGVLVILFDLDICLDKKARYNNHEITNDSITRILIFAGYMIFGFFAFPTIWRGALGISLLLFSHVMFLYVGKLFKIAFPLGYINFWLQELSCFGACLLAYFYLPEAWLWWKYYLVIFVLALFWFIVLKIVSVKLYKN